jgi:hypothetical protein
MAKVEAEETALKKELEAATIAERGTELPSDTWETFRQIFLDDERDTPANRLKMQECLRDIVYKITVDTIEKEYTVHYKGSEKRMEVTALTEFGCTINGVDYRLKDDKEVEMRDKAAIEALQKEAKRFYDLHPDALRNESARLKRLQGARSVAK